MRAKFSSSIIIVTPDGRFPVPEFERWEAGFPAQSYETRNRCQDRSKGLRPSKALGRAAYRLARDAEIVGKVDREGEDKRLTEYRRGYILIDLWRPWRSSAFETEFSRLRVTYAGEKVLELRWDRADSFTVVLFKAGEWEGSLATDPI